MEVSQIKGLNQQARKYLLKHNVSKKAADVMAVGFTGYLNGGQSENLNLIRKNGKWKVFNRDLRGGEFDKDVFVLTIQGNVQFFLTTQTTI